jgi:hypothetical protein
MRFFSIVRVIQADDLYIFNMDNIVEKRFGISIALVRSRSESLVV